MNFLKRAVLAVTRRKGKTIIMFIIFAAIANLVLAGLSIQHATEAASTLARQKLGSQLTLRFDMQSAMQKARAASTATSGGQRQRIQAEPITEDMAKTIASQKNITGYNYLVNANGSAVGFSPVDNSGDTTTQNTNANTNANSKSGQNQANSNYVRPDVTVTGTSLMATTDVFTSGDAKILSGRGITPDDSDKKVAVIEKNLADQNGLKVGSSISIKATRSDNTVVYSIVGIYQNTATSTSGGSGMGGGTFTDPYNRIFVDYKSAIPLKTVTSDTGTVTGGIDSAVFTVDDPKNIDTVKTDAKAMNIDWTKFTLDANDAAYKQMTGPIENVASFSMMVVYIVAIAGALILALILMLFIKERMYETGVLLSMGEGKWKIILQYVTEVVLIAVVAFGISAFSGKAIAQGVGNMLVQNEVQTAQNQASSNNYGNGGNMGFSQRQGGRFGGYNAVNVKSIDSLNVQLTSREMGQMSAVGLLIIILGTILPASTVMRYKPKAILTKAT